MEFHAPSGQCRVGPVEVINRQDQAAQTSRTHLVEPGDQRDTRAAAGRLEIHPPSIGTEPHVGTAREAQHLDVELLGPILVRHRDRNEPKLHDV
jgi:hypothetical protein